MEPHADPTNDTVRQIAELIGGQDPGAKADRDVPRRADSRDTPVPAPAEPDDATAEMESAAPTSETAPGEALPEDQGDAEETEQPVTVKDLAEKLGLDAKDLYDELTIPLGDDATTTLGEWKDRVKALQDIDGERDQVLQVKEAYERDLMKTRHEVNALMSVIPQEIREQVIEQSRQRAAGYEQEQKEAVLAAIPDWKDPDKMATDRAAIVKLGVEYGFSEPEITYTQDARTVRMLHDFTRLRERFAAADAASKRQPAKPARQVRGQQTKRGGRKLAQVIRGARESKDIRTKEAAIAQLIREQ